MAAVVGSKPSSVCHRQSGTYRWLLTQSYAPVGAGDARGAARRRHPLLVGAVLLSPWTDLADPNRTREKRAPRAIRRRETGRKVYAPKECDERWVRDHAHDLAHIMPSFA
jgi:hypothetical protein